MMTGLVVLKIVLTPSRQRLPSLANSGPRWSMSGGSIARSTRTGSGVGPGICRKSRPAARETFCGIIGTPSDYSRVTAAHVRRRARLVGLNSECDIRVNPHGCQAPPKRGIQYTQAAKFRHKRRLILDHPHLRTMTAKWGCGG